MDISEKYHTLYTFAKGNTLTTNEALDLVYCYWEPSVATELIEAYLGRDLPSDATPSSISSTLTEREKLHNAVEFLTQLQGTCSLHDLLDWVAYQWQIPDNTGYEFDYSEEGTLLPDGQDIEELGPQELAETVARLTEATRDLH